MTKELTASQRMINHPVVGAKIKSVNSAFSSKYAKKVFNEILEYFSRVEAELLLLTNK